jgi:hypothetical protein
MGSETLPEFRPHLNRGWFILRVPVFAIIYLGGIAHGRKRAFRPPARGEEADPSTT